MKAPSGRRRRVGVGAAAVAAAVAVSAPTLLRLDPAAYPKEPEKRQALDLCGRTDPTFVRFLASDRDACYRRLSDLAPAAAGGLRRPDVREPVIHLVRR
jgi:hypothetical protein